MPRARVPEKAPAPARAPGLPSTYAEGSAGSDATALVASAALITGRRLLLRAPVASDAAEFIAKVRRSRALHHPWVQAPATEAAFQAWITRQAQPDYVGMVLIERASGAIAGVFNLSHIVHGVLCSAYLGYYALSGHEGRGLMHEGLGLVLRLAFGRLGLHRVEANIQPGNLRSIALVRARGFALEGYSPRYLKLGGRWRDHERWAILADGRHLGASVRRGRLDGFPPLAAP
jgi:ribosomal-protein-alanine N-acetyltransferase